MAPGWVKELAMAQERELVLERELEQQKEMAQEERLEPGLARVEAEAQPLQHSQILKPDPTAKLLISEIRPFESCFLSLI
jgi:hypothetical protein